MTTDLFEEAREEVLQLMSRDSFKRYAFFAARDLAVALWLNSGLLLFLLSFPCFHTYCVVATIAAVLICS